MTQSIITVEEQEFAVGSLGYFAGLAEPVVSFAAAGDAPTDAGGAAKSSPSMLLALAASFEFPPTFKNSFSCVVSPTTFPAA